MVPKETQDAIAAKAMLQNLKTQFPGCVRRRHKPGSEMNQALEQALGKLLRHETPEEFDAAINEFMACAIAELELYLLRWRGRREPPKSRLGQRGRRKPPKNRLGQIDTILRLVSLMNQIENASAASDD
jgi:hypothetical protein